MAPTDTSSRAFFAWLRAQQMEPLHRRFIATAARRLSGARQPGEPDDIAWMAENATKLADRVEKLSPASAATYVSRFKSAASQFLSEPANPFEKALFGGVGGENHSPISFPKA